MNLEENERVEEWFLIVGDWVRNTGRNWFYALALTILLAIPMHMVLKLAFEEFLLAAINPIKINYQEVSKQPLEVVDKQIFDLGNNFYSGYARIKNQNSNWGVASQKYQYAFKNSRGNVVSSAQNNTFILSESEKIIVFPRFESSSIPTSIELTLSETQFIRPPSVPVMNLEIQRRSVEYQLNQTIVNAVIVNQTPFKISRVDIPVLLFDNNTKVIGVNYTNINDLGSNESRSFQYVWYNRINNVARIEIIPELNVYNRELLITAPGQNPFDDRE